MRGLASRTIRLAGRAAAASSLIGFAGGVVRIVDLASHFRVAYALAILPALAIDLPRPGRGRLRAIPLVLAWFLNFAPIAALYLPAPKPPDPSGPSIRILQFNTWPRNIDDRAVVAFIESERPDVAALQETSDSLRGRVARDLSGLYEIESSGAELILLRRDPESIRLLGSSRVPMPGGGEAIAVRLEFRGREVAVLGLHAMAPLGFTPAAIRDAQFEAIARWSRDQTGPAIVLGDLNATPWSAPFRRLLRDGDLADSTQGFGVQPTWRVRYGPLVGILAWPLRIPIDHVLHSPGLSTTDRRIGEACGSNHFPILATLLFGPGRLP